MATSNIDDYVRKVAIALDEREGVKCAELLRYTSGYCLPHYHYNVYFRLHKKKILKLSFQHSHIANARLRVEAPEAVCSRYMGQPFDEMVAAHIKTIWASSKQNHDDAWQYQNMCVTAFIKGMTHINIIMTH